MMSPMQDELTAAIAADLGIKSLPLKEQKALIAQFGEVPEHENIAKQAVAEEVKRFKASQVV